MILGDVTEDCEIVLGLEGIAKSGTRVPFKAVLDTGFNGYLTVPTDLLAELDAQQVGSRRVELGDGQQVDLDVYLTRVEWLGKEKEVLALAANTMPLVGIRLVWNCRLSAELVDHGTVEIEPIPQ